MDFFYLKYVLLVLYMNELSVHYKPIATTQRCGQKVKPRQTQVGLLINNMQSFTASMTCLDPYTRNVLYHRVRSGR